VDACDHSLRAFNWYVKYFHHKEHQIGLVHIYNPPELAPCGYTPETYNVVYNELLDEQVRKSEVITNKFQELCKKRGMESTVYTLQKADSIGQSICNFAKEKHAACIVMGQRGLGAVKRTVFGSVSEHVLHHAHVTVLIVPPPKGHKCSI